MVSPGVPDLAASTAARPVLAEKLERGLEQLGLDSAGVPCAALLDYLELLVRWNSAYNLTAVRDPAAMVTYHLLDSLTLLTHLPAATRCLDIGSGGGLPGAVLALARPHQHWVLLDSNRKKTRFLEQARMELGISNIEVVRSRIEDYRPEQLFDVVTARALADMTLLCHWAEPLLAPGGQLLAMKAVPTETELALLRSQATKYEVQPLTPPGLDAPRSLVRAWFNE